MANKSRTEFLNAFLRIMLLFYKIWDLGSRSFLHIWQHLSVGLAKCTGKPYPWL